MFRVGGEFGVEVVREDPGGVSRLVAVAFTVADAEAIVTVLNRSAQARAAEADQQQPGR